LISVFFQRGGLRSTQIGWNGQLLQRFDLFLEKGGHWPAVNERVDPVGPTQGWANKNGKRGWGSFQPMTVASAVLKAELGLLRCCFQDFSVISLDYGIAPYGSGLLSSGTSRQKQLRQL
jgi:hypothetical protein